MRNAIRGPAMAALAWGLAACGSSDPAGEAPHARNSEVCAPAVLADAPGARPATIPALQLWQPGASGYAYGVASRIVLDPADGAALAETAQVLAEDLERQGGRRPAIMSGTPVAGDIALSRGHCDARLGAEGYGLRSGPVLEIQAQESAGVFYGTRTLLQLLAQGSAIPAGHALDWPRYPERGLMVDAGRKYFTPEWLRQHIRELAWLKLNVLHLHFSDNQGFRIESERHPEIVSAEHLSKAELRELVALARRHHVTLIGEIGMPGHMTAALAPHPEFQLTDANGEPAPDKLDITNPLARQYARELVEEFLPLFPGRYWHTGGDEYMASAEYRNYPQLQAYAREKHGADANAKDAVLDFVNWLDGVVRSHGRTARFWHDGVSGGNAVNVNPDTVVEWWTDFNPIGDLLPPPPQEFLDRGHTIGNASYWPLYYTVGAAAGFPAGLPPRPDLCSMYESWEVNEFTGPLNAPAVLCQTVHVLPVKTVATDEARNLGAKLFVWTDSPEAETEAEIAAGIAPRLRIVAQKTWNSPRLTPRYAAFQPLAEAIGHAPGYSLPAD
ncbi:beta-N-acetylhexosaminidase [Solimonas sp. K1W22B-7]|uniref:beta-N-acetylhexosaminidase n=1 Tax=Solimonas sp. K1W22B-7 TaxID=2303331 RepID=UPI0013C40D9F|nr:beta-N-acetylhexosaminidase [Solimonas sp. K1W22B-7]